MTCEPPLSPAERDELFCAILNRELVCALGCTEPIAVAYAAALARETLGREPERLDLACSGMFRYTPGACGRHRKLKMPYNMRICLNRPSILPYGATLLWLLLH